MLAQALLRTATDPLGTSSLDTGRKAACAPLFCVMTDSLNDFIIRLARTRFDGPVHNQYGDFLSGEVARANAVRRANLSLYLGQMAAVRPALLLVGEAPGYRGCRLTGVPFTSEAILLEEDIWPFGRSAGYRKASKLNDVSKEATATMVWSALDGVWPRPLLWNAFPFHPHRPGWPLSNRQPLVDELKLGARILAELMDLIPVQVVAAVGNSAAKALTHVGVSDYHMLRHPSHGGKALFQAGLEKLIHSVAST